MKSHPMFRLGTTLALCGLAFMTVVFRAHADEWDKKTILTVDQPIQVRDTYLEPGTYVLKLANSSSDRHIVQIFNSDQSHIINTVMAIPNYRLQPTGNSRFAFWETPAGHAKALRAWFYPGDNFGQEFPYPKHLRTIEVAAVQTVAPPPPPALAPEPPPAPAPEPQVQTQVQQSEEQVEIAQNTPPPPPAEQPAPPPPVEQPQVLPKTATPFALIGLCGLLSLGLYSFLRMQRSS